MLATLLAVALWLPAGFAAFVLVYNRLILHVKEARLKRNLVFGSMAAFTGSALAAALVTGWSAWLGVPVTVLVLVGIGELARLWIRHACRADGPVETRHTDLSLWRPITTHDLAIRRYEVSDPRWTGGRLRVVLLSDLHVHGGHPLSHYREVMRQTAGLAPDLLLLAGDFVSKRLWHELLPLVLEEAKARLGAYAVLGNHDYWEGGDDVIDILRAKGIAWLGNGTQHVTRDDGSRFILAGCEDPWGAERWQPPADTDGDPILMLTHTADNIYKLRAAAPLAVFAGHYHAGQAVIPRVGPLVVPSKYGRRFHHGHFLVNGTHLFVTAGIGSAFPPVRIFCKPEILVVDFMRSQ